jgi:hypothetical protein
MSCWSGLVKNIRGAEGEGIRGKTVCRKARPLLGLEIEGPNVEVVFYVDIHSATQCIFEVSCCIWICEAAGLQSKVADANERLGISFEALATIDVTRADYVRVLADVSRGVYRVMNYPLGS